MYVRISGIIPSAKVPSGTSVLGNRRACQLVLLRVLYAAIPRGARLMYARDALRSALSLLETSFLELGDIPARCEPVSPMPKAPWSWQEYYRLRGACCVCADDSFTRTHEGIPVMHKCGDA